jgi:surface antigen
MRAWTQARTIFVVGSILVLGLPARALATPASHDHETATKTRHVAHAVPHAAVKPAVKHAAVVRLTVAELHTNSKYPLAKNAKARIYGRSYGGISCVPFARSVSGIDLKGNAANWWDAAAGVYERGNRPEPGSVMNFRATGRMRLGHVAVVSHVISSREVEIDHANWWGPGAKGGVSRGIPVIDVSENNNWSAVRVGLGRGGDFGSVYPTYGFIYDRPDRGTMVANNLPRAQMVRVASVGGYDEVAEAVEPRRPSFTGPVNRSLQ